MAVSKGEMNYMYTQIRQIKISLSKRGDNSIIICQIKILFACAQARRISIKGVCKAPLKSVQ